MSDRFRVFGTQLDPSVVEALLRQDQQREASEMNRAKAATKRRKAMEKRRSEQQKTFERN